MNGSIQSIISFVLYILLFAWIGYRRGTFRELTTLIVSIGGFFLLQYSQGSVLDIITLGLRFVLSSINLGSRFLASVQAGQLVETDESLFTLTSASDWISASNGSTVTFLVWAVLLLFAYFLTSKIIPNTRGSLIAALLGIINGLFYSTIFLPLLVSFIFPHVVNEQISPSSSGVQQVLRGSTETIQDIFGDIWSTFEPQQPILVAIGLTVLLVAIVGTLRRTQT